MIEKNIWISQIKKIIKDISDLEYQKRAWLGIGPEVSSPEEIYCTLFDDFMVEDFLRSDEIELSEMQRSLFRKLIKDMESIAEKYSQKFEPKILLRDEKWLELTKLASELFKIL